MCLFVWLSESATCPVEKKKCADWCTFRCLSRFTSSWSNHLAFVCSPIQFNSQFHCHTLTTEKCSLFLLLFASRACFTYFPSHSRTNNNEEWKYFLHSIEASKKAIEANESEANRRFGRRERWFGKRWMKWLKILFRSRKCIATVDVWRFASKWIHLCEPYPAQS